MSLLHDQESTGGAVARTGFEYQDAYALLQMPEWLSQDAFTGIISELIVDIEICFSTEAGDRRVFIEAKNNHLSQPDFWKEIATFEDVSKRARNTYNRFCYVSPGIPAALAPMRSRLVRMRGVGSEFKAGELVMEEARTEFVEWVVKNTSQTAARARFVLDFVDFEDFDFEGVGQRFAGAMSQSLPVLADLPGSRVRSIEVTWRELIYRSVKGKISRVDIEDSLLATLSDEQKNIWLSWPSTVVLERGLQGEVRPRALDLSADLRPFLADSRMLLTPTDWQNLHDRLARLGEFLLTSRPRKRVLLSSELRMSAAIVLGAAFKAVKGHRLLLEHRGNKYELDNYAAHSTSRFFDVNDAAGAGREGVVSIQIGNPTRADVAAAAQQLSLTSAPALYLESLQAIPDVTWLNTSVSEAKKSLVEFRSTHQLDRIHLFVKGPSFFAMALGHRLNGVGEMQIYDWIGNAYCRTGLLRAT